MTGLAGIFYKNHEPDDALLTEMLKSIAHRGNKNIIKTASDGKIGIGICYYEGQSGDIIDFGRKLNSYSYFILDGKIENIDNYLFNSKNTLNYMEIFKKIINNSNTGFSLGGFDGENERLILARDVIGIKPLYFCESQDVFAFCTEKKGLWKVGMVENIKPIYPGEIVIFSKNCLECQNHRESLARKLNDLTFADNARHVEKLLEQAVLSGVNVHKAAILFSGGLDSCIIAYILNKNHVDLQLFCAGFPGCRDIINAVNVAERLNLPLEVIELSDDLVKKHLETIVSHLESTDTVTAEIATPFFFATKHARAAGFFRIFSGQGADELFGGYSRYEKTLHSGGHSALQKAIEHDTNNIWHKNIVRDDKICMANGVELIAPYLDRKVVEFSLTIPPEFKVKQLEKGSGFIRKYILRKVGEHLGMDKEIFEQPKTAVQYGSGASKCYRRLARVLMNDLDFDIDQIRTMGFQSNNEVLMNYIGLKAGLAESEIKNDGVIKVL